MQSIAWTSLPTFYNVAWSTMPFKVIAEAQEFIDFLVSHTRYRVWALTLDRNSANVDDRVDDSDVAWCSDFRMELVCVSVCFLSPLTDFAQNAHTAFLGCFQLQNWRFVLPDVYREICRIMNVEMSPSDHVFLLCRLSVVVDASDQTAFADRFPWKLTAVPRSHPANLKKIIRAYRKFRQVCCNYFDMAANDMYYYFASSRMYHRLVRLLSMTLWPWNHAFEISCTW